MGNPVVHFEVVGRDAQALESFYKDAFDWPEFSSHKVSVKSPALFHANRSHEVGF